MQRLQVFYPHPASAVDTNQQPQAPFLSQGYPSRNNPPSVNLDEPSQGYQGDHIVSPHDGQHKNDDLCDKYRQQQEAPLLSQASTYGYQGTDGSPLQQYNVLTKSTSSVLLPLCLRGGGGIGKLGDLHRMGVFADFIQPSAEKVNIFVDMGQFEFVGLFVMDRLSCHTFESYLQQVYATCTNRLYMLIKTICNHLKCEKSMNVKHLKISFCFDGHRTTLKDHCVCRDTTAPRKTMPLYLKDGKVEVPVIHGEKALTSYMMLNAINDSIPTLKQTMALSLSRKDPVNIDLEVSRSLTSAEALAVFLANRNESTDCHVQNIVLSNDADVIASIEKNVTLIDYLNYTNVLSKTGLFPGEARCYNVEEMHNSESSIAFNDYTRLVYVVLGGCDYFLKVPYFGHGAIRDAIKLFLEGKNENNELKVDLENAAEREVSHENFVEFLQHLARCAAKKFHGKNYKSKDTKMTVGADAASSQQPTPEENDDDLLIEDDEGETQDPMAQPDDISEATSKKPSLDFPCDMNIYRRGLSEEVTPGSLASKFLAGYESVDEATDKIFFLLIKALFYELNPLLLDTSSYCYAVKCAARFQDLNQILQQHPMTKDFYCFEEEDQRLIGLSNRKVTKALLKSSGLDEKGIDEEMVKSLNGAGFKWTREDMIVALRTAIGKLENKTIAELFYNSGTPCVLHPQDKTNNLKTILMSYLALQSIRSSKNNVSSASTKELRLSITEEVASIASSRRNLPNDDPRFLSMSFSREQIFSSNGVLSKFQFCSAVNFGDAAPLTVFQSVKQMLKLPRAYFAKEMDNRSLNKKILRQLNITPSFQLEVSETVTRLRQIVGAIPKVEGNDLGQVALKTMEAHLKEVVKRYSALSAGWTQYNDDHQPIIDFFIEAEVISHAIKAADSATLLTAYGHQRAKYVGLMLSDKYNISPSLDSNTNNNKIIQAIKEVEDEYGSIVIRDSPHSGFAESIDVKDMKALAVKWKLIEQQDKTPTDEEEPISVHALQPLRREVARIVNAHLKFPKDCQERQDYVNKMKRLRDDSIQLRVDDKNSLLKYGMRSRRINDFLRNTLEEFPKMNRDDLLVDLEDFFNLRKQYLVQLKKVDGKLRWISCKLPDDRDRQFEILDSMTSHSAARHGSLDHVIDYVHFTLLKIAQLQHRITMLAQLWKRIVQRNEGDDGMRKLEKFYAGLERLQRRQLHANDASHQQAHQQQHDSRINFEADDGELATSFSENHFEEEIIIDRLNHFPASDHLTASFGDLPQFNKVDTLKDNELDPNDNEKSDDDDNNESKETVAFSQCLESMNLILQFGAVLGKFMYPSALKGRPLISAAGVVGIDHECVDAHESLQNIFKFHFFSREFNTADERKLDLLKYIHLLRKCFPMTPSEENDFSSACVPRTASFTFYNGQEVELHPLKLVSLQCLSDQTSPPDCRSISQELSNEIREQLRYFQSIITWGREQQMKVPYLPADSLSPKCKYNFRKATHYCTTGGMGPRRNYCPDCALGPVALRVETRIFEKFGVFSYELFEKICIRLKLMYSKLSRCGTEKYHRFMVDWLRFATQAKSSGRTAYVVTKAVEGLKADDQAVNPYVYDENFGPLNQTTFTREQLEVQLENRANWSLKHLQASSVFGGDVRGPFLAVIKDGWFLSDDDYDEEDEEDEEDEDVLSSDSHERHSNNSENNSQQQAGGSSGCFEMMLSQRTRDDHLPDSASEKQSVEFAKKTAAAKAFTTVLRMKEKFARDSTFTEQNSGRPGIFDDVTNYLRTLDHDARTETISWLVEAPRLNTVEPQRRERDSQKGVDEDQTKPANDAMRLKE